MTHDSNSVWALVSNDSLGMDFFLVVMDNYLLLTITTQRCVQTKWFSGMYLGSNRTRRIPAPTHLISSLLVLTPPFLNINLRICWLLKWIFQKVWRMFSSTGATLTPRRTELKGNTLRKRLFIVISNFHSLYNTTLCIITSFFDALVDVDVNSPDC